MNYKIETQALHRIDLYEFLWGDRLYRGEDRMGAREFKVAAVVGIIGMSSGGSGGG